MSSINASDDLSMASGAVLELPGLYGPFTFPEKLLQKIWLRREFDITRARTMEGLQITLIHPGKWNLMGGPDFRNARLRFGDGPEISGDIELHLHASDWSAHRHAHDPAYNGVILHVVLFTPAADHITRGVGETQIPVLSILSLLHHDLEEYAAEDAIEFLANRPAAHIIEMLGVLSLEEVTSLLTRKSNERWEQKVRYARLRIKKLGWSEACHQTALEILGYRFNRAPMLRVAAAFPLRTWSDAPQELDFVFESGNDWSLQGLRPANHPRVRLRQYTAWTRAHPDWPERLIALAKHVPDVAEKSTTGEVRRINGFPDIRREWIDAITAGAIGGTRFDNLMCDGFLPLLAAHESCDPQPLWFHWFPGDVPPLWRQALRQLEVFSGRLRPACHGLTQGLLGWLIERERSATVSAGRRA